MKFRAIFITKRNRNSQNFKAPGREGTPNKKTYPSRRTGGNIILTFFRRCLFIKRRCLLKALSFLGAVFLGDLLDRPKPSVGRQF